ncbi:hypothetical protein HOLleu_06406 [Holothuria leucospilota]|uniref:Kazal-like domain-containing protein n=1 Tax=Holothuria leucospilota TaxID=206669 RepID=A0A9Q1CKV8_HOLLE|nr:hypothetical protein HOLleu_06406 [Holothuria leucospilota]
MTKITTVYLLIVFSLTSAVSLRRQTENEDNSQLLLEVERLLQDIEPDLALDEYCASVRRDCVMTGNIFKRNLVCASNFKRYLNPCHLQIRSCDLKRKTGEVLTEKRCLWINIEDESGSKSNESGSKSSESGDASTESGDTSKESGVKFKESGGKSKESGGKSKESGDKSRESEGKSKESGGKSKESGGKSKESGGKSKKSGGKSKESGGKSKKSGESSD